MITGYNTDIRHKDVVFHVQTEDKGSANPFVESLVYVKGQVIANKRTNYADLVADGKGEKAIVALIEHQHRVMIAAIKGGKLDDKVGSLKTGKKPEESAAAAAPTPPPAAIAEPKPAIEKPGEKPAIEKPAIERAAIEKAATEKAAAERAAAERAATEKAATEKAAREKPAEAQPAPAATAVAEPEPRVEDDKSLDQVILEYLSAEAEQEQLALAMNGESDLALGKQGVLQLKTTSSKSGQPVAGAQVTVRMISTVAYPRTLAQGETDGDGRLRFQLDIPLVEQGIAALIISASSDIGNAELKHLL